LEVRWPVPANHFWSNGALVETTRKGSPTHNPSSIRRPKMGYVSPWGARLLAIDSGVPASATVIAIAASGRARTIV
jgi:hypothetical protein